MKSTLNPNAVSFVPAALRAPPFVIVLVGPPGSGKTTQGEAIAEHYGFEFLPVYDTLRERRKHDVQLDAHWSHKYCTTLANDLLDDTLTRIQEQGKPGLVVEYVKTPDQAVIVEEMCRRHGMKVGCTLWFDVDNVLVLISRLQSRNDFGSRRIPALLLAKIHEFLAVEEAFTNYYLSNGHCHRIQALNPCPQVTLEVFSAIDNLRGPTTARVSSMSPRTSGWEPLPAGHQPEFFPSESFLEFVSSKAETLRVWHKMQNFIGIQHVGKDRKFPGALVTAIDVATLGILCAAEHRYAVSKKIAGTRFLLLWTQAEGETPGQCYLIDQGLAVFRAQIQPESTDWGNMLLDGELVTIRGKGVFVVFDVLYFDSIRTMSENLDSRMELLKDRFQPESVIDQHLGTVPNTVLVVYKIYHSIRNLPRLVQEFEVPMGNTTYPTDGLIFTSKKNGYKTAFDKSSTKTNSTENVYKWQPLDKMTFDFRLVDGKPGLEVHAGRTIGKEVREVPYGSVDGSALHPQHLQGMLGAIVECKAVTQGDRSSWGVQRMRADKTTPNREDQVQHLMDNNIPALRLVAIYHEASQTTPETSQAPPIPHGSPATTPIVQTHTHHPLVQPSPPMPDALSVMGGAPPGPFAPHPNLAAVLFPPMRAQPPPPLTMLVPGTPNAPSRPPVPHGLLDGTPTAPVASVLSPGAPTDTWVPLLLRNTTMPTTPGRATVVEGRTNACDLEAKLMGVTTRDERRAHSVSPPRLRWQDIRQSPMRPAHQSPPRSRFRMEGRNLSRAFASVSEMEEQQENNNKRSPNSESWRRPKQLHGNRTRRTRDTDDDGTTDSPHVHTMGMGRHTAIRPDLCLSPISSTGSFSPGMRNHRQEFITVAKEWLIRKFCPRPSAAKPRPFTVLDLCCGTGSDITKWDKAKASSFYGCDKSPNIIEDARSKQHRDIDMRVKLCVADALNTVVPAAYRTQKFDVVACFFGLEYMVDSLVSCRKALQNVAKHLKKGGRFLGITTDAQALVAQAEPASNGFGNEARVTISTQNPDPNVCGQKYKINNDVMDDDTYIIPMHTFIEECRAVGLDALPQEHGVFNLQHDIGGYIERSASKRHVWVDMPKADREFVGLYCSFVFEMTRE